MEAKTILTAVIIILAVIYLVAAFLCFTDDGSGTRRHLAATILFWPFLPIIKSVTNRALTVREVLGFGFLLLLMLVVIILSITGVIT
ncbi:MAG: hypothetical protein C9356_12845 [Oleiphilus sp.]|nr:MAG: hypothetical protein C9356_12845 [Oleiphilus sp.]